MLKWPLARQIHPHPKKIPTVRWLSPTGSARYQRNIPTKAEFNVKTPSEANPKKEEFFNEKTNEPVFSSTVKKANQNKWFFDRVPRGSMDTMVSIRRSSTLLRETKSSLAKKKNPKFIQNQVVASRLESGEGQ